MLAISANYCRFSLFMEIYLSFLVILLVFSFLEVFKKENKATKYLKHRVKILKPMLLKLKSIGFVSSKHNFQRFKAMLLQQLNKSFPWIKNNEFSPNRKETIR